MFLKLTDDQKRLVDEISALSGIQKEVIRECWEFTLIRWTEQIASNPGKLTTLEIPFIGKLSVRYEEDTIEASGAVSTKIFTGFEPSTLLKKLVGDIEDEGDSVVTDLLKKKIEVALVTLSVSDTN